MSDGVLSMYIMGDPFCEMFGQHYSKPYPKEVLQDAAKLAVDQALLLKSPASTALSSATPAS